MVLEAGEIDSGKVRVGVFAEVVYGKGKRDPVSGRWEKLDTASGYIKAVDAEHLTIVLRQGFGKKRIAFARIQKLILAESRREMGRLKDTLRRRKGPASILQLSEGRRIRIRTLGAEEEITAGFHRATRDTLFLQKWRGILGREKRRASIALTDISRLEVHQYRKSYAMTGAIIGAAAGIAAGTGRPPRGRSASPDPTSHATDCGSYGRCPRRLDARSRCLAGRRSVAIHR